MIAATMASAANHATPEFKLAGENVSMEMLAMWAVHMLKKSKQTSAVLPHAVSITFYFNNRFNSFFQLMLLIVTANIVNAVLHAEAEHKNVVGNAKMVILAIKVVQKRTV